MIDNLIELPTLEIVLADKIAYNEIASLNVYDRARWATMQGELLMTTAANETSEAIPRLWFIVNNKYPKMYFTNHGLYPQRRWDNLYSMLEKGMNIEILNLGYTEKDVEKEYGRIWETQQGPDFDRWRKEQKHGHLNYVLSKMNVKPVLWIQGITDWREDKIVKKYNGLAQFYPFVDMTKEQLKQLMSEWQAEIYPASEDVAKSPHTKLECGNRESVGMFINGDGI
ncbi:MAG: hypothetical protein ACMXYG_02670 [Candidatus Woesearchaeota archaeon]